MAGNPLKSCRSKPLTSTDNQIALTWNILCSHPKARDEDARTGFWHHYSVFKEPLSETAASSEAETLGPTLDPSSRGPSLASGPARHAR
jgi:hypothetical protein